LRGQLSGAAYVHRRYGLRRLEHRRSDRSNRSNADPAVRRHRPRDGHRIRTSRDDEWRHHVLGFGSAHIRLETELVLPRRRSRRDAAEVKMRTSTRDTIVLLAAGILMLAGGLPGCGAHPPRPSGLVIITLDTTRADRLPAYGF